MNGPGYLLVGVASTMAVLAWLAFGDAHDVVLGNAGGTVVLLAAILTSHRVGRAAADPAVREFWRLWSYSAVVLAIGSVASSVRSLRGDAGMPLYEAVPILMSLSLAMLAFRHVPLSRRSGLDWLRLLLDGAAVAVAGSLLFGYVVLDLAPPGTPVATRVAAGVVGVVCLLALVVFGRAAASPEGRVDAGALRILATAPVIGIAAMVLFLAGDDLGRMLMSVLGYPLVGLATCAAACRQGPATTRGALRRRWRVVDPLQVLAVAVTAGLVVTVSARDLDLRGRAVIVGAVLFAGIVVGRQLISLRVNTLALRGIRRQQAELERLALSDALTGLPSRTGFGVALAERLAAGRPATALLLDIDDFKLINDTLGPAAADQLLGQVGERLRDSCGPDELVARLGGDEFAVLLPVDDPAAAQDAAARFQATVGRPVHVGEQQFLLNASVGIAVAGAAETADEVLRNADIAMYAAKESGKASWVRYLPSMRHDMAAHARLAGELHDGLERDELRLVYQPVFDIVTGRMHGAEALVRWQHPERGFVSPGDFIPVAERSGLIVPLGSWVLRTACEQLARWRAAHGDQAIEAVNVNVAVRQLREPGFVGEVAAVLRDTGLTPRNLIIEVTESSVVDGRHVQEALRGLHEMGVRLALDDFGTGQSSLSLLRAFPVDVLKLDKSFVDGITGGADRGRLAVAAAVAQLAENLELKAVAEGIETEEQRDRLRDMGYRYGQGYLMAKPLPADAYEALMVGPVPVG